jgi:hypothetical protein
MKIDYVILDNAEPPRVILVDDDGEELACMRGGISGRAQALAIEMVKRWNQAEMERVAE